MTVEDDALFVVKKRKPARSQNGTLHMWFGEIANYAGHTADDIKQCLKQRFGPTKQVEIFLSKNEIDWHEIPMSTADYSKEQMSEFMQNVQDWCAEFGIPITRPIPEHIRDLADKLA